MMDLDFEINLAVEHRMR